MPPELVFDQRIGAMFVARIAGNIANADVIGSLEFATALAGAKLIVVLATANAARSRVRSTMPSWQLDRRTAADPPRAGAAQLRGALVKDKALVQRVAEQNAKDAAAQLTSRSETMAGLVREGKLKMSTPCTTWRRQGGLARLISSASSGTIDIDFSTARRRSIDFAALLRPGIVPSCVASRARYPALTGECPWRHAAFHC